jgi:ribosomal-protein-alanine N-acetyltransferase
MSQGPGLSQERMSAGVQPRRPVRVDATGVLSTSRMTLRPLRRSDGPEFVRAVSQSRRALDAWFPLHEPGESDEALFERHLALGEAGDRSGGACRRAGFLADGRLAGGFNLVHIARGLTFEADATWWVSSEVQGQGLGAEGMQAMLDLAFMDLPRGLGLHRVMAGIVPGNVASEQMALRVGFRKVQGVRSSLIAGGRVAQHDLYVVEAP